MQHIPVSPRAVISVLLLGCPPRAGVVLAAVSVLGDRRPSPAWGLFSCLSPGSQLLAAQIWDVQGAATVQTTQSRVGKCQASRSHRTQGPGWDCLVSGGVTHDCLVLWEGNDFYGSYLKCHSVIFFLSEWSRVVWRFSLLWKCLPALVLSLLWANSQMTCPHPWGPHLLAQSAVVLVELQGSGECQVIHPPAPAH